MSRKSFFCFPASYGELGLAVLEHAMTAATAGPSSPSLFSSFTNKHDHLYGQRREAFILSLLGQALTLGVLIYLFAGGVIDREPNIDVQHLTNDVLPLVFMGHNGGGGGSHDQLPASHGNLPQASLNPLTPPTINVPKEMPKLPVPEAVEVAPDVKLPQSGPIGDPLSKFTIPSNGPGGPGGISTGCCDGVGDSTGPGAGNGPEGIYPGNMRGMTVPQVIFNPEPSFSDEARKAKTQGRVGLLLVVGKDGRTYNIRVRESLGMGLDEKAIEAVKLWRFKPATLNGTPVATQILVEVDFHLY
jgi:periplasmic protein TonB